MFLDIIFTRVREADANVISFFRSVLKEITLSTRLE